MNMKSIKLSKLALSLLCGSFLLFTSCGKSEIENIPGSDKEQQEPEKKNPEGSQEPEKKKPMMLNPVSLKLKSNEEKNITIENGEAPYDIKVVDGNIARVISPEGKSPFTIIGLEEGKTEIIVTDKNKSEARATVVVDNGKPKLQPLRLSKSKVELTMGSAKAKESLNVQSGRFPYTPYNYDPAIVKVDVWDSSITLTAVKQGKTIVKIYDKVGAIGEITVVVK